MTRLKELLLFSAGILVGWFAWMVVGQKVECPQCYVAAAEPSQDETLADAIEQSKTVTWGSGPFDFQIVYVPSVRSENVEELERAYDAAQATIMELRGGYAEQVLAYQQQIEQLEGSLASEKRFLSEIIAEKDQLKNALKQLRTDYIALANKNAALERASIEELAKSHKNGEKVSRRELPPIMQAVVNMGGVPSGKPVPRPVLP